MANTRFQYVRAFEQNDALLKDTFLVVRIDGCAFHRFSEVHGFTKPNDVRALQLMDRAAEQAACAHPDVMLAFGQSDEYSFLLRRATTLFNRRGAKILSTFVSLFSSAYLFHWPAHFSAPPKYPPSFDARIVLYPTERHVRDYFSWRQADTHINNLYNTAFWALVQQGGQSTTQAHETLKGTLSKHKHELLHSRFGINYNNIDARFRKGSVLRRELVPVTVEDDAPAVVPTTAEAPPIEVAVVEAVTVEFDTDAEALNVEPGIDSAKKQKKSRKNRPPPPETRIMVEHCDIIGDEFWIAHPEILES